MQPRMDLRDVCAIRLLPAGRPAWAGPAPPLTATSNADTNADSTSVAGKAGGLDEPAAVVTLTSLFCPHEKSSSFIRCTLTDARRSFDEKGLNAFPSPEATLGGPLKVLTL